MYLPIELSSQQNAYIQRCASRQGVTPDVYLAELLNDGIIAEMLKEADGSPGTPVEEIDFDALRDKVLKTKPGRAVS